MDAIRQPRGLLRSALSSGRLRRLVAWGLAAGLAVWAVRLAPKRAVEVDVEVRVAPAADDRWVDLEVTRNGTPTRMSTLRLPAGADRVNQTVALPPGPYQMRALVQVAGHTAWAARQVVVPTDAVVLAPLPAGGGT